MTRSCLCPVLLSWVRHFSPAFSIAAVCADVGTRQHYETNLVEVASLTRGSDLSCRVCEMLRLTRVWGTMWWTKWNSRSDPNTCSKIQTFRFSTDVQFKKKPSSSGHHHRQCVDCTAFGEKWTHNLTKLFNNRKKKSPYGVPVYYHHARNYPRRARSAIGVDTVFTLDECMFVCLYVCMLAL